MSPIVEPRYVMSLEEILWGGTLVAITMVLHGFGMLLVLRVAGYLKHRFESSPSFLKGIFTLILASWMILLVHLTEVLSWAMFFLHKQAVNSDQINASLCYYFALLDYTTLGCPYNLVLRWRLLEGMIAMAGLLTFAWSTGVLLTLAQDFQDQQLQRTKRRREKHETTPGH
jgi:hypothetical protein